MFRQSRHDNPSPAQTFARRTKTKYNETKRNVHRRRRMQMNRMAHVCNRDMTDHCRHTHRKYRIASSYYSTINDQ